MQYLKTYVVYQDSVNEGLKNWIATFLVMANLGLVPLDVKSASKEEKKEFVDSQPQDKLDAALFVDFINKNGTPTKGLGGAWSLFTQQNPQVQSKLGDVQKYVQQDGKKYMFDKQYQVHDYSSTNIYTQAPDNYLSDWGGFIPDEQESGINNLIAQYEAKTSVEIFVLTIESLDGEPIEYYAQDRGEPNVDEHGNKKHKYKEGTVGIGIGKKWADNGVLIVVSKKDRKWRIHTGRGIESFLTDAQCSRIGNEIITTHFKKGEFYEGLYDAVKEIEDEIGQDNIEIKKQWQIDKAAHDKIHNQEMLDTALNYLAGGLILSLIGGTIYYFNLKRRKKKEAAEKERKRLEALHENIDQIIKMIEKLKSSVPDLADFKSKTLMQAYEEVKKAVKSINIPATEEYSNENLTQLKRLYRTLDVALQGYKSSKTRIESNIAKINSLSIIKKDAYTAIDRAAKAAEKIKQYGYKAGDVPSRSDVDTFDPMMLAITALLATDVDGAISKLSDYYSNISGVTSQAGNVETKLSGIEGAISRINGWKDEVESTRSDFDSVADSGEKSKADKLVSGFEAKVKSSKDWVALSSELDKVVDYINGVTKKYEEIARRKREAEEEAEEEERRKKRRKEEEEESSRRSSYSSSSSSDYSSSSSSFGGGGGGDFGGGGASGGW